MMLCIRARLTETQYSIDLLRPTLCAGLLRVDPYGVLLFYHHLELRITTAAATQNSKCIIQNFLFLCFTVLRATNNGTS